PEADRGTERTLPNLRALRRRPLGPGSRAPDEGSARGALPPSVQQRHRQDGRGAVPIRARRDAVRLAAPARADPARVFPGLCRERARSPCLDAVRAKWAEYGKVESPALRHVWNQMQATLDYQSSPDALDVWPVI